MSVKFIDLFCGLGGFRVALEKAGRDLEFDSECVFSSDIDPFVQKIYFDNFGEAPFGDLKAVNEYSIPNHDLLLAGFPCQPFSIIGKGQGFDDTRGTLFFDIARILNARRPRAFVLENVKQIVSHNQGRTLSRILMVLNNLGYSVQYKVLNALDFGLPQKRERVFIIGQKSPFIFDWDFGKIQMEPLSAILESDVSKKYYASEKIVQKRKAKHTPKTSPSVWHENKSGNISSYPYSCALRAGASYNYLLVNGERRLTPREMFRLQGFPDTYQITVNDSQARKQAGNSLPVPMAYHVLRKFLPLAFPELMRPAMEEKYG